MQEIDGIISLMEDGHWYNLEDVTNKSRLPKPETSKILEFLAKYNFIDFDSEHEKIRINPSLTKFLKESRTC